MKPNRYPENPYPPGSYLAASWDANEALRRLGWELRKTPLGRLFYRLFEGFNAIAKKIGGA